tara:strand:+ start:53 stop:508 length:456 start_codon:yes stop_codon:yes gene_type:complete
MQAFYKVTTKLKEYLLAEPFVNTVTYGNISDVDLDKQTIFPLSHLQVSNVEITGPTLIFNVSILLMDIVDISNDETVDNFTENDNTHDILNTQLAVVGRLAALLKRGDLFDELIQVIGNPIAEPFEDRFTNKLAGWSMDFQVEIPNDSTTC